MTDYLSSADSIDVEEIAVEVFATLDGLEVEDLWDRSGSSRDGYTAPVDAAAEMVEEELQPFLDDVEEYLAKGTTDQALVYGMGVILGLYRFAQESESEFKGWAEDCPLDNAEELLGKWRSRNQDDSRALAAMDNFICQRCSQWVEYLVR